MKNLTLQAIGKINIAEDEMTIQLDEKYIPALQGLDGFGHVQVLWWFDGSDSTQSRSKYVEKNPYKGGPDTIGVFATRSPERPNPLALTCVRVTRIDPEKGILGIAFIDAEHGSLVLDIKPYTPSIDRVEHPIVPQWCAHWPKSCEASASFDWESVFNY